VVPLPFFINITCKSGLNHYLCFGQTNKTNMKNIVSYGGGTQSTALILMALNGDYGLQRPDFGVYADTGGEPEFIDNYVRWFINYIKQHYDFDIYITKNKTGLYNLWYEPEKISEDGRKYTQSLPPFFVLNPDRSKSMIRKRQCTEDYKVKPFNKLVNSIIGREPYVKWFGISFDERSRMKISTTKRITYYYPLVEKYINRVDSINYIHKLGIREPQRSSCFFCPYHSDRYWQWLKDFHPTIFHDAVDFENVVRARSKHYLRGEIFLHRSCKPLDQIQFTDKDQLNMFPELIDECGGECGI